MGDRCFPSSQEDDVFPSMNQDFSVSVDYDIPGHSFMVASNAWE
jgi:hypothetical protein